MKPCQCGKPVRSGQRSCTDCHAAYMREHRRTHRPTEEQRRRGIARAYANVYLRRGKLTREPCADCGATDVQMHHEDYDRPLVVVWLCRRCHLARHRVTPSVAAYAR